MWQAVASRLSFHDPATGAALAGYSLQICIEDASFSVTAQLSHDIIQDVIGEPCLRPTQEPTPVSLQQGLDVYSMAACPETRWSGHKMFGELILHSVSRC